MAMDERHRKNLRAKELVFEKSCGGKRTLHTRDGGNTTKIVRTLNAKRYKCRGRTKGLGFASQRQSIRRGMTARVSMKIAFGFSVIDGGNCRD